MDKSAFNHAFNNVGIMILIAFFVLVLIILGLLGFIFFG